MARGGRGGGRGVRGGPQDRETLISKKLSWLLRHGAEKEGLKLGKGGYVGLADVVSHDRWQRKESELGCVVRKCD